MSVLTRLLFYSKTSGLKLQKGNACAGESRKMETPLDELDIFHSHQAIACCLIKPALPHPRSRRVYSGSSGTRSTDQRIPALPSNNSAFLRQTPSHFQTIPSFPCRFSLQFETSSSMTSILIQPHAALSRRLFKDVVIRSKNYASAD